MANLQHVQPGQPLAISSSDWNKMTDAARAFQLARFSQTPPPATAGPDRGADLVLVRNDSGSDQERFAVVGIDGPIIGPDDHLDEFKRQVTVSAVTPTADHAGRFVVLAEPLAIGRIGTAWVSGVCAVQVQRDDIDHGHAELAAGQTGHLVSGFEGSARILWHAGGSTGWAVVALRGGRWHARGDGGLATPTAAMELLDDQPGRWLEGYFDPDAGVNTLLHVNNATPDPALRFFPLDPEQSSITSDPYGEYTLTLAMRPIDRDATYHVHAPDPYDTQPLELTFTLPPPEPAEADGTGYTTLQDESGDTATEASNGTIEFAGGGNSNEIPVHSRVTNDYVPVPNPNGLAPTDRVELWVDQADLPTGGGDDGVTLDLWFDQDGLSTSTTYLVDDSFDWRGRWVWYSVVTQTLDQGGGLSGWENVNFAFYATRFDNTMPTDTLFFSIAPNGDPCFLKIRASDGAVILENGFEGVQHWHLRMKGGPVKASSERTLT